MFRLRYAVALAAAAVLISPGVSQSAVTNPWTGKWSRPPAEIGGAAGGVTTLTQNGSSVTGSFNWGGGGSIGQVTLSGSTLTGTWTAASGGSGTMTLTINADATSFTGQWHGTTDPYKGRSGDWTGTYIGTRSTAPTQTTSAAATRSIAVKSLVGEVRFRRAGVSRPLKPGDKLQEGDSLSTDFDSHVVLEVGNGAEVTMGELTQVRVNSLFFSGDTSKLQLNLRLGQVEMRAPDISTIHDDFSVVAPTATASIRGTRFSVRYAKTGVTTVRAIVHSVRVTPANRSLKAVTLQAGQQVTVTKRKVGPVTKISK